MNDMPGIEQLGFAELQRWLSDRLQLQGLAAADIDRRRHETPYELPLQKWQTGDDAFRGKLGRAVTAILRDCRQTPWTPVHFHNLALLIEEAGIDRTARTLGQIAYDHEWLALDNGRQLHMLVLRTLLGLGHCADPDFWLQEGEHLGGEYPELIFRGLMAHGLGGAFSKLGDVAHDAESLQRILELFPALIDTEGLETVKEHAAEAVQQLPRQMAAVVRKWFPEWDYGALRIPDTAPYEITNEHFSVAGMTAADAADDGGWDDVATTRQAQRRLEQALVLAETDWAA